MEKEKKKKRVLILTWIFFLIIVVVAGFFYRQRVVAVRGEKSPQPSGGMAGMDMGEKEQAQVQGKKGSEDLDMSGMTVGDLEKEGKMVELAPGTVQISSERQQLTGVRTEAIAIRELTKTIRAVGRVDYNEKAITIVNTKVGGWIEKLFVDYTGKLVNKGQPLLSIYSPELVSTQEEYLLALKGKKELSSSSLPEITQGSVSLLESTKKRLLFWDITEDQIDQLEKSGTIQKTLLLYSPANGYVIEKDAFDGKYISPGETLYRIADLSTVWVNAEVYEYEIPFIRVGQEARITLSYFPGEVFTGKAIYIYPYLDQASRTVAVRFELSNPHGKLKPNMYANVDIKVYVGKKLAIRDEAVLDSGKRQIAFVDKGQGYFEPRELKLGAKVENYYEVLSGVKEGERVVTSANFLIDSESKLKEAAGAMGGHAGHGAQ
ncbi:MAG TPA: efflux RND transporter periplasmic adaptor subunit [Thermodesulfobacteriota bacterium]|nr:efflux RND transporter periplasmic adaptor subunit [Thermodesulfobacteriota bacterium]